MCQTLDDLIADLSVARDTEAAARMDVKDRKADEAKAIEKRAQAERRHMTTLEQERKARCAVIDYIDWQTRSSIEEADELMKLRQIEDKRK